MKRLRRAVLFCIFVGFYGPLGAVAFELNLPATARLTAERASAPDSFEAPIAGFNGTEVPSVLLEGTIQRRSWRIDSPGVTTLQVLLPLRQQLESAGYEMLFECDAVSCGGFDFRFEIEVLPGPNMYVNISRYRYLTAVLGDPAAPSEVVSVLVSVTAGSAYVQIIAADTGFILPEDTLVTDSASDPETEVEPSDPVLGLENQLSSDGHAILEDLEFATGSTDLGSGPYGSLQALARFLAARPNLRLALVGHTDTVGGLDTNIALSRARARSVRERLISGFGADGGRLDAEGMGYLAPIASNLTEQGRTRNRRVEVIVVSEN